MPAQLDQRAGIEWDTFYRKRTGRRPITRDDVSRFAMALGLNPEWLATGDGAPGGEWRAFLSRLYFDARALDLSGDSDLPKDGHDPEPLVIAAGWMDSRTKRGPQGRPRKNATPPKSPYGPRVTGERKPDPGPLDLDEIVDQLRVTPEDGRLRRVREFVDVELDQPHPQRGVLKFLLGVAAHLTEKLPPECIEASRLLGLERVPPSAPKKPDGD